MMNLSMDEHAICAHGVPFGKRNRDARGCGGRPIALTLGLALTAAGLGCQSPGATTAWLGLNPGWGLPCVDPPGRGADREASGAGRDVAVLKDLKVTLVRDFVMNWGASQPGPEAVLDFTQADRLIKRADEAGARMLAVFQGVPRWAAAGPRNSPIDLGVPRRDHADAFDRYVRAFVERYGRRGTIGGVRLRQPVVSYQFMDQIERIPAGEYAWWLRRFSEAVKQVDPEASVVMGSLSSPGVRVADRPAGDYPTYLERLLEAEAIQGPGYPYFDVAAFTCFPHAYPGRTAFDDAVAYLERTLGDRGIECPVWVTAFGSDGRMRFEKRQAADLVRWAVRGRSLGLDRLYLYQLSDGHDSVMMAPARSYGLLREAEPGQRPARKPAYFAVRTLLARLADQPRVEPRASNVFMLTGQGDPSYLVWRQGPGSTPAFVRHSWWEVQSIDGQTVRRQGANFKLPLEPVLLRRAESTFLR